MDLNEKIKSRREELGLSDVELAQACGLTIHSYCDIELYPDELCKAVPLQAAKRLSSELRWNFLDMLEIPCAFCARPEEFEEEYSLPRSKLIRHQRGKHGWSVDDLGNRVNYRGIEISVLEADPDRL